MQTQSTPQPESTLGTPTVVPPQRSNRRATARRASNRRATARQYKDDIDGRIVEYVKEHPQSTTGDMAKGLNANRDTIAAEVSHMVRAGELTKELGSHTLSANE
jgi:predicted HTH transcriptional regulator